MASVNKVILVGYLAQWLKLVDRLDAYLWALLIAPTIRFKADWQAHAQRIANSAEDLGCDDAVFALLNAARK